MEGECFIVVDAHRDLRRTETQLLHQIDRSVLTHNKMINGYICDSRNTRGRRGGSESGRKKASYQGTRVKTKQWLEQHGSPSHNGVFREHKVVKPCEKHRCTSLLGIIFDAMLSVKGGHTSSKVLRSLKKGS